MGWAEGLGLFDNKEGSLKKKPKYPTRFFSEQLNRVNGQPEIKMCREWGTMRMDETGGRGGVEVWDWLRW